MLQFPNTIFFETLGSYWWFNEDEKIYLRSTKGEAPRERPEWGNEKAGPLQDFKWHPYKRWAVTDCFNHSRYSGSNIHSESFLSCCPHLRIETPRGNIVAPNVVLVNEIRLR